ncbi:putative RlpA-like double-psi beta-barrel domain-containing protein, partial [Tanacetum coccineum]
IAASSFEIKAQTCKLSGGIRGKKPPAGQCNHENDSDCCGGDGGGLSACDEHYHLDDTPVVALLSFNWMVQGKG